MEIAERALMEFLTSHPPLPLEKISRLRAVKNELITLAVNEGNRDLDFPEIRKVLEGEYAILMAEREEEQC